LKLAFRGIEVQGVYPQALPDLFKGSQLVLIGKYAGEGPVTVLLTGKVGKAEKQFVIEGIKLTKENTYNFLPRLWATRRIGYLLEEIRLHGASTELVEEVTKLGMKFGIVTPYTSFLVTEKERMHIDTAAPEAKAAFEAGKVSGAGAVRVAKATQALKAEDLAPLAASEQIRYKDDKTFYLKDGIWVDSLYKEGGAVKEIKFNSDEYFRLLAQKPSLAKYASVGTKLIICFEGVNYKITE
jgi:Ca-activated chloride channel family protein